MSSFSTALLARMQAAEDVESKQALLFALADATRPSRSGILPGEIEAKDPIKRTLLALEAGCVQGPAAQALSHTTAWWAQSILNMLTGLPAFGFCRGGRAAAVQAMLVCATKLLKKPQIILLSEGVLPAERAAVHTWAVAQQMQVVPIPLSGEMGRVDLTAMRALCSEHAGKSVCVFPQVCYTGVLEAVAAVADTAAFFEIPTCCIANPGRMVTGGLCQAHAIGRCGTDFIAGIFPCSQGEQLGVYGIGEKALKKDISPSEGAGGVYQFKGELYPSAGAENMASVAHVLAESILQIFFLGETGLQDACNAGRDIAFSLAYTLQEETQLQLSFPQSPSFEVMSFTLPTGTDVAGLRAGLVAAGVPPRITEAGGKPIFTINASHIITGAQIKALLSQMRMRFGKKEGGTYPASVRPIGIPETLRRPDALELPEIKTTGGWLTYLKTLAPAVDAKLPPAADLLHWALNLPGFDNVNLAAPSPDIQGALEVAYTVQEIAGNLPGVRIEKVEDTFRFIEGTPQQRAGLNFTAILRQYIEILDVQASAPTPTHMPAPAPPAAPEKLEGRPKDRSFSKPLPSLVAWLNDAEL